MLNYKIALKIHEEIEYVVGRKKNEKKKNQRSYLQFHFKSESNRFV